MTKVVGISIERSVKGVARYARIDLRKFPEFIPMLEEKGALYVPNAETEKAMLDAEKGNVTCVKDMNDFRKKIYG